VNKNWDYGGGYVALNSFGFGGANAHVLLRSNQKPKPAPTINNVPRLIAVSGRTNDAVSNMLKNVRLVFQIRLNMYMTYIDLIFLDF